MKKILAILLLVLTSTQVQAAGKDFPSAVDGTNYFPSKKNQPVPETGLTYVRLGRSITTYSDSTNATNFVGSLGHRRYADNLMYGLEYTYHYALDSMRYTDFDITAGYRFNPTYRVIPYVFGGAGLSFSSDASNQGRNGGSGINYFVDFGVELFTIDVKDFQVKIMSGLKMTHQTLTGASEANRSFTDMYIGIGFGW